MGRLASTRRVRRTRPGRPIAATLAALLALASLAGPAGAGEGYRLLVFEAGALKWGPAHAGTSATVTWTLQRGERHEPEAINCRDTRGLDGLLENAGLDETAFRAQAVAAFAMWRAVSGIEFVEAAPGAPADLVIGAQIDPRGIAWTNVEYAVPADVAATGASPASADAEQAFAPLTRAAICLNPEAAWRVGFDGDRRTYDLRHVLAHEIGHAIGLDHPGRKGDLMGFAYQEGLSGLSAGDVAGARLLYGPPVVETAGSRSGDRAR